MVSKVQSTALEPIPENGKERKCNCADAETPRSQSCSRSWTKSDTNGYVAKPHKHPLLELSTLAKGLS